MTLALLGVELRLARLALKHAVAVHHPKIEEARRRALLYISEGMPAGKAVELAEVLAFALYAVEDAPSHLRVMRRRGPAGG